MKHYKRDFKEIQTILSQISLLLKELYKERLMEIIVFGSFAKKRATEDSDIDIAIVLSGTVDKFKEIDRVTDAIYGIMLDHNELFSFLPVSQEEIKNPKLPFYDNIRKEGIRI